MSVFLFCLVCTLCVLFMDFIKVPQAYIWAFLGFEWIVVILVVLNK